MTLKQILALVGPLDDTPGNETSRERFRRFLQENAKDVGQLRDYIQECLTTSGPQYNRALQDLVNHIGLFLEFEVVFGRYQGVQGENGFDGHWKSPKAFHIVTETKTTDVFAINALTLIGYIDGLIAEQKIPSWENALGLYVVGRPDAELKQLENAIIVQRRTHQLRVISVESLLSLAEMMTEYDVTHQDILDVLCPSGPRIDPLANLMARLVAQSQDETQPALKTQPPQPPLQNNVTEVPATRPAEHVAAEVVCWLSPVRSENDETAEECVNRLVGKSHYYAFSERAPGRKHMKEGDRIAFYATTKGVVADAVLLSAPQKVPRPDGLVDEAFPWVCALKDVRIYTDAPLIIDAALRLQLDAFDGRNSETPWSWFVKATHKVSSHDFGLLTRTIK
jgi:hypothetical protein